MDDMMTREGRGTVRGGMATGEGGGADDGLGGGSGRAAVLSRGVRSLARGVAAAGLAGALVLGVCAGCSSAASADAATPSTTQDASAAPSSGEVASTSVDASGIDGATEAADGSASEVSGIDVSSLFSDRDLDASYDASTATSVALSDAGTTVAGEGVTVEGSTVTITAQGTYVVSGTLTDGQLVVDVDDASKVQIVLEGASVTSSQGAALYVKGADKVFLTLADGSQNALATSGEYVQVDDNNVDGAVFSKSDLTVNGGGALSVTSATGHGIVCKDDLTLVSGAVDVTAAGHAIQANDSIAVRDGTYVLSGGTDGVHCSNDEDASKGWIVVEGGSLTVSAVSDGFDASGDLLVDGGTIVVDAGDDGLHSDGGLTIEGGSVTVAESYEGLEGATVTIDGGEVDVTSSDDGINASGQSTSSGDVTSAAPEGGVVPEAGEVAGDAGAMPAAGEEAPGVGPGGEAAMGGVMGGGMGMDADATAALVITGGTVSIDASGDGIDSNGTFSMSGGTVYVSGPTDNGNGALDVGSTATITGGTIIAAGSSGMATAFSEDGSTQCSAVVYLDAATTGTITLSDPDGVEVASFTPAKQYSCVVVSAPGMAQGSTWTLTCDGSVTSLELTGVSTSIGSASAMGGGAPSGMGARRPDAQTA